MILRAGGTAPARRPALAAAITAALATAALAGAASAQPAVAGAARAQPAVAGAAARLGSTPGPVSPKRRFLASMRRDREREAKNSAAAEAARKAWEAKLDRRIGKPPDPVLNLHNVWTHETLPLDPKGGVQFGRDLPKHLFDWFMRCHFANRMTDMDPRLLQVLVKAAAHFHVDHLDIISGYRSPKYNLMLRKEGHQVARNSQHTHGHAVDFRVPGVSTRRLRRWARSLRLGGVGYYPQSRFVHVDTWKIRTWVGR